MSENTNRTVRVRASELEGRAWLNTGDKNLTLQDLRGKIVILDFWTLCCINCLHVLDELRPLEEEFSDVLVTVGVHSPKFEHEADPVALAAAVDRYHITHPVLDDPELTTWQAYTARAWPTLVVVDPEGYIVAHLSGEGHVQGLTSLVPEHLREQLGYDVLVADTVNHRLRSLNLRTGEVRTLAGNGVQRVIDGDNAITGDPNHIPAGVPATEIALSSPWDAVYSREAGQFIIAMAGTHQLFGYEPVTGAVSIFAGSGVEGLADGPAADAWFAQPSGIIEARDGSLWVACSETSGLRHITFTDNGVQVTSAVGKGLFDFGFVDGDSDTARMQHPLGLTELPDGSIAVADTYNGAIRRWDPATGTLGTLERGLDEPSDLLVEEVPGEEPRLIIVETNAHQLVRASIPAKAQHVDEGAITTARPSTKLTGGTLEFTSRFTVPTGQKLDTRWGDPTQLKISSTPENFILEGAGTSTGLTRTLVLNPEITEAVLHITARAAACDGTPDGDIPEHAACHLYQQDWGIPVIVTGDEADESELVLDLRGIN